MSPEIKKEWIKQIFIALITILTSLVIFAFTFKKETRYSEDKELRDKVIQLDKEKASTSYVDQKCLETKNEIETKMVDIKEVLRDIKNQQAISNQDIKEILKTMPRK